MNNLLISSKCTQWSRLTTLCPSIVPSFDASAASINESWHCQVVIALVGRETLLTKRLQAICPLIDGGKRDIDCLAGIEPLELLLAIPHIIAAAPTKMCHGYSSRREKPSSTQACASRLAGSIAPMPGMPDLLVKGRNGSWRMRREEGGGGWQ